MFVTGWGLQGSADAVAAQFEGEIASAFYPLTDRYVGAGLTTIFEILIVTGSFACCDGVLQHALALLLLAGPRGRAARARWASVHPTHRSPYVASMLVTTLIVLYVGAFTIADRAPRSRRC